MEKIDLDKLLESVDSKEKFLQFVSALRDDKIDEETKEKLNLNSLYESGANGWENGSIATF